MGFSLFLNPSSISPNTVRFSIVNNSLNLTLIGEPITLPPSSSKALEFLNQALFNYEIYTVNRELMKINVTDSDFDRKSILRDSILNKERIKQEALNSLTQ